MGEGKSLVPEPAGIYFVSKCDYPGSPLPVNAKYEANSSRFGVYPSIDARAIMQSNLTTSPTSNGGKNGSLRMHSQPEDSAPV